MKMKAMPRVLILLFTLSVVTMLFIAKCGILIDSLTTQNTVGPQPEGLRSRALFEAVMEEREKTYQLQVEGLKEKIKTLNESLMKEKLLTQNLTRRIKNQQTNWRKESKTSKSTHKHTNKSHNSVEEYLQNKIQAAEIFHGVEMKTEYELTPFNRFTLNRIYIVDPGLGKRVVEKPIGMKKKDLSEVIQFSIDLLNEGKSNSSKLYTHSDFIEGIYRTEYTVGTHYELYFRNILNTGVGKYSKVTVMRPYGPLLSVSNNLLYTGDIWINLILPLKGRTDAFRSFMKTFTDVCILQDQRVFLTVVYFGSDGFKTVKGILESVAKTYNYKHMKLVNVNENFSRGRGLKIGTMNWQGSNDVVLFMCDVDIVFNVDFLERCRLNTEQKKRVYYPIVFSLYNPNVVYSLQEKQIPKEKDQLVISKHSGFWRDFGFGMTCQYLSDFNNINGFDEHITGWGGEDVALYKKYLRSDYIVIRATDPAIFHLWHEKVCDPSLSHDQYQGCIRSKSLNEASHAQLGFLAFKDEINIHRLQKKKLSQKSIASSPVNNSHVSQL